jgi:hypothetical protein
MPKHIGAIVQGLPVTGRDNRAVRADIGEDDHLATGTEGTDFGLLKRAKTLTKGNLLRVV